LEIQNEKTKLIILSNKRYFKRKKPNNCFNLTIPVVMVCAVAALGTNHAKPFGPELQVKQMLDAPFGAKIILIVYRR